MEVQVPPRWSTRPTIPAGPTNRIRLIQAKHANWPSTTNRSTIPCPLARPTPSTWLTGIEIVRTDCGPVHGRRSGRIFSTGQAIPVSCFGLTGPYKCALYLLDFTFPQQKLWCCAHTIEGRLFCLSETGVTPRLTATETLTISRKRSLEFCQNCPAKISEKRQLFSCTQRKFWGNSRRQIQFSDFPLFPATVRQILSPPLPTRPRWRRFWTPVNRNITSVSITKIVEMSSNFDHDDCKRNV